MAFRGEAHFQARQQAELDRLPGQGIGAGDHGLACDDGRERGEDHEGQEQPGRCQQEEGVVDRIRVRQDERALPEIVQGQRRKHDGAPGHADRVAAEMAEIGIERLGAGDGQTDAAEDREGGARVRDQEGHAVIGVECEQDLPIVGDMEKSKARHGDEPQERQRTEEGCDLARAVTLRGEESDQDRQGAGQDIGLEGGGDELQAFEGREHGDGRRDGGIAIEQGGTRHAHHENRQASSSERALCQCDQGQRAALALVVGPQQQENVFDGNREDQRPEQSDRMLITSSRVSGTGVPWWPPVAAATVSRMA